MAKQATKAKTKAKETKVKLTKETIAACKHVIAAFKAEDKAASKRQEALTELAQSIADWLKEHPKASAAYKKAYREEVRDTLEKGYEGSSLRARLTQVWTTAELAVEHGSMEDAAKALRATGANVDAIYRARNQQRAASNGKAKATKATKATKAKDEGLPLSKATMEALTANDIARLTRLANALAKMDAKMIASTLAELVADLDDKGREMVKQAILAAC